MTQYNGLNVKLSNSQLNKSKSAIKNETEVVLRLSSNRIGDYSDFPQKLQIFVKLLLTNHRLILVYRKSNYLRCYNQSF